MRTPLPKLRAVFQYNWYSAKKNMWFIGVEVEQETGAPPPKKNLDPPLRVTLEHCIKGEESIYGWKLQGHIYKTMIANFGYECLLTCRQDKRCQSFNWVISLHMCDLSNRTKEARPEDLYQTQTDIIIEDTSIEVK